MDEKKLVELVTKEVMSALAAKDGIPAQRPAAGDWDLELAGIIDHTLLRPDATEEEVVKLCAEARQFKFCSVCVNTSWVSRCRDLLRGSGVKVCCVVGFPLGAMDSRTKAFETREAIGNGADEIDMVINIGAMKSGDLALVEKDIRAVVQAARDKVTKVILEACSPTIRRSPPVSFPRRPVPPSSRPAPDSPRAAPPPSRTSP
jgi:hypothetical protein